MDQSRDRISVRRNRVLLVEGSEDAKFLSALVKPPEDIQILQIGGKGRLKAVLRVVLEDARKIGGLHAIAVLRDADEQASSAFESVRDALKSNGLTPPDRHREYSESDRPAVGIFVAPDGESPGSLESLCVQSVSDTPEARCTEDYLECIATAGNHHWNAATHAKAFAYAYLAVGAHPEKSLQVGGAQGTWNRDSPVFGPLRAFVEQLATVGGSADAAGS